MYITITEYIITGTPRRPYKTLWSTYPKSYYNTKWLQPQNDILDLKLTPSFDGI